MTKPIPYEAPREPKKWWLSRLWELPAHLPDAPWSPTPSSSGKTLIVATSGGNVTTTALVDGRPVVVGLNAYIKK